MLSSPRATRCSAAVRKVSMPSSTARCSMSAIGALLHDEPGDALGHGHDLVDRVATV